MRKLNLTSLTRFLILTFSLSFSLTATNLFTNGGFDTNLSGWSIAGGCVQPAASLIGNPGGSAILNSCGETSSDPVIWQTVTGLTIGLVYNVSVDYALFSADSGSNINNLGIFLDSQPGNPILLTQASNFCISCGGPFQWATATVAFTAVSTSHTIYIAAELDGRTPGATASDWAYYVDNATFTEAVPEPRAVFLAAFGLLGGVLIRRRRR